MIGLDQVKTSHTAHLCTWSTIFWKEAEAPTPNGKGAIYSTFCHIFLKTQ